jgi:hypothetical protein
MLAHDPSMRVCHPPRIMRLGQIVRRSVWRKNDVLLYKRHGRAVLSSLNPFFRPWLFGRISPAALFATAVLAAAAAAFFVPSAVLAIAALAAAVSAFFLLYGYRWCVIYVPAEGLRVPFRDRLRTLAGTAVYIPCIVTAHAIGSVEHRFLML